MKPAIVLLSGGMDSATVLAMAKREYEVHALSFSYGQRHSAELEAARKIARDVHHLVLDIDLRAFGGSALTDDIDVPHGESSGIPVTYVPARNTIFLSYALAYAETLGSSDIFIGVNALDYNGYPDCRPEYIAAFEQMANLATKAGVEGSPMRIHAPLIGMTKKEIILRGLALGVDYSETWSCYDPDGANACGICDACTLRHDAFLSLGMKPA